MAINADPPVLQIELDTIAQEISYNGTPKVIPESYWKDTLSTFLYPLWDSDKDKLISFHWYTNGTYHAKRRKFLKNFKTDAFEWKDYEMEQADIPEATQLKDKLIEAFYLIDSLENEDYQKELGRLYAKQRIVTPFSVRLARNFLLSETDWVMVTDSPLDADTKAKYTLYRQKLRELTGTAEFATEVENTKFPISPDFYTEVWSKDFPGIDYLTTPEQFLPLGKHYLKAFREKISYYLLQKSLTETAYFPQLLLEYENVRAAQLAADETPTAYEFANSENSAKKDWLDRIIFEAQAELDALGVNESSGGS